MLNDLQFVLRSRAIVNIFAVSIALRIFFHFIVLPSTPSRFGPDEAIYAALAKYVSSGLSVREFPGYGAGLYNSAKSFTLLSVIFIKVGMNELDAVRLTSSVYGLASLLLLSLIATALHNIRLKARLIVNESMSSKTIFLIGMFAFFPSNFIWSIIGLRESASQFWLMLSFYALLKTALSLDWRRWTYFVSAIMSVGVAHGTRPETAYVFSIVTLLFLLVLSLKVRNALLVLAMVLGMLLGHYIISDQSPNSIQNTELLEDTSFIQDNEIVLNLKQQLLRAQNLEYKRNINAIDAASALPKSSCVSSNTDSFSMIKCSLSELPYRLFAFLFRPLLFFDWGSPNMTLAAVENLVWLVLIPFCSFMALRKNKDPITKFLNFGLVTYIVLFSTAAALYEGNLGTAFRHKSSILWPLVIILIISSLPNSRKN